MAKSIAGTCYFQQSNHDESKALLIAPLDYNLCTTGHTVYNSWFTTMYAFLFLWFKMQAAEFDCFPAAGYTAAFTQRPTCALHTTVSH